MKRPVRAGDCADVYAIRPTGRHGPALRLAWVCRKRHGFMLKHWRCLGLQHPDCPNAGLDRQKGAK